MIHCSLTARVTFSANLHQVKIDRTLRLLLRPSGPAWFCSVATAFIFMIRSRRVLAQSWRSLASIPTVPYTSFSLRLEVFSSNPQSLVNECHLFLKPGEEKGAHPRGPDSIVLRDLYENMLTVWFSLHNGPRAFLFSSPPFVIQVIQPPSLQHL